MDGSGLPWHSRPNIGARLRRVVFHGNEEENMGTNFVLKMSQKYGLGTACVPGPSLRLLGVYRGLGR